MPNGIIRLSKKGFPASKDIIRSLVGIHFVEGPGELVRITLDEYEVLLSPEKADAMADQIKAKVRRIKDRIEEAALLRRIEFPEAQKAMELGDQEPK